MDRPEPSLLRLTTLSPCGLLVIPPVTETAPISTRCRTGFCSPEGTLRWAKVTYQLKTANQNWSTPRLPVYLL
ncbi:hypothetical protein F4859DRAFT_498060 [Xylaria cf. heliscus]|nr:hypothetical protein F4859DRAFT_498060 [Xylaria cf. heliscus]